MARTQPLVLTPVMTTVSTPSACSVAASVVPKKALAYCLTITSSSLARRDLRHDLAERAAVGDEVAQRGDLADEQPAVDPVLVVRHPGVQHRDGRGPGGGEDPGRGGEAAASEPM